VSQIHLGAIDYAVLVIYFAFVLGIGWMLRRSVKSSDDFFLSGRSIPAWIAGLAFLSANLGAQEVIGMAASGAKYGIMTSHRSRCLRTGEPADVAAGAWRDVLQFLEKEMGK
jgi:SSS family solute:Na+ symporter